MKHGSHLIMASLLLALPALAQAPAPETVTSEAQRQKDELLSRKFVEATLQPSFNLPGQFAKWVKPLCVNVLGLSTAAAGPVEKRVREVAKQVGAPVNPSETCDANAFVFVTPDPLKTLDYLATKNLLKLVEEARPKMTVRFPIQAWYMGQFIDNRGRPHLDVPYLDALYGSKDGTVSPEARAQAAQLIASDDSRLQHGIQPQLANVSVIVDANAVQNMSLGSLADYIAWMVLAQTPASGKCLPAPSIANLFVKECDKDLNVTALSEADMAMLGALYDTPLEPANLQQTRIIGTMRRRLEGQGK